MHGILATNQHERIEEQRMPTAYWVSLYSEVHDPEKLAAYAALAGPAIEEGGGRYLARGNPAYAFENGKIERVVVIEFPSVEAAHAVHESAGYQEALVALDGGASRDLRIVEGIE
jgi:uncharacterized protein (DUF1330 family)